MVPSKISDPQHKPSLEQIHESTYFLIPSLPQSLVDVGIQYHEALVDPFDEIQTVPVVVEILDQQGVYLKISNQVNPTPSDSYRIQDQQVGTYPPAAAYGTFPSEVQILVLSSYCYDEVVEIQAIPLTTWALKQRYH